MQATNPILYPLNSAAEVLFVEESLAMFRAKAGTTSPAQDNDLSLLMSLDWEKMTQAQKLALIEQEWTLEVLRDIKPWVLDNETVVNAFDLCAAKANGWMSFSEVCQRTNMISSQGRGQMQALTKKTKNQMKMRTWPMLANRTPPGGGGLAYLMSDTLAARWKQVRSEP